MSKEQSSIPSSEGFFLFSTRIASWLTAEKSNSLWILFKIWKKESELGFNKREQQKVLLPKLTEPASTLLKYIEKNVCSQLACSACAV